MASCSLISGAGPGTTAANFLKFGIGARPAAMGGAFTAVADDVNSIYWNPAGLASYTYSQVSLMHDEMGEEMRLESMGFSIPSKKLKGSIAGSYTMLNIGGITGYNVNGAKTGTLQSSDKALSIAYAKNITPYLAAGVSLKSVYEKLDSYDASAYGTDAGLLLRFDALENPVFKKFRAGITIKNMGTQMKFINDSAALPSSVTGGIAYCSRSGGHSLTAALDANFPSDNKSFYNAGVEYTVNGIIGLRCGYRSNDGLANGISAGLGINVMNLGLDYAFNPRGDFGSSHKISVSFSIGKKNEDTQTYMKEVSEGLLNTGVKQFDSGEYENSLKTFEKVLVIDPGNAVAVEYKIEIDEKLSWMEEQKRKQLEAEKLRSELERAESIFKAGLALYEKKQWQDALGRFKEVLTINPSHDKAKWYMADTETNLTRDYTASAQKEYDDNHYDRAMKDLQAALTYKPGDELALQLSEKIARQIREINRSKATELNKLALAAYSEGSIDKAIGFWKKALEFDPDMQEAQVNLERALKERPR